MIKKASKLILADWCVPSIRFGEFKKWDLDIAASREQARRTKTKTKSRIRYYKKLVNNNNNNIKNWLIIIIII